MGTLGLRELTTFRPEGLDGQAGGLVRGVTRAWAAKGSVRQPPSKWSVRLVAILGSGSVISVDCEVSISTVTDGSCW